MLLDDEIVSLAFPADLATVAVELSSAMNTPLSLSLIHAPTSLSAYRYNLYLIE